MVLDPDRHSPRYDISRPYAWNYEHAPEVQCVEAPHVSGEWRFCGLPVDSPLGIPAGPLLNGKWCLYYASLGFDVLTYKTVRSNARECYPLPNLQPVRCDQLANDQERLQKTEQMEQSWAVSFGMPSQPPKVWRNDVTWTKNSLPSGKLLCVSVVGTMRDGFGLDDLADDYAVCAKWAVESGADAIEINLSCPNVATRDGQLFQQPAAAGVVAARVRDQTATVPLLAKIGYLADENLAAELLVELAPHINGLSMTNSVSATVVDSTGRFMFEGQRRGICGNGIRDASLEQVKTFSRLTAKDRFDVSIIGLGGISCTDHVKQFLDAGASATQIATAAMLKPELALCIKAELGTLLA